MPVIPVTVVVELLSSLACSGGSCSLGVGRTAAEQRWITEGRERRMSSGCSGSTALSSHRRGCFSLGGADDDDAIRGKGSLRFSAAAAAGPHIFGTGMNG